MYRLAARLKRNGYAEDGLLTPTLQSGRKGMVCISSHAHTHIDIRLSGHTHLDDFYLYIIPPG